MRIETIRLELLTAPVSLCHGTRFDTSGQHPSNAVAQISAMIIWLHLATALLALGLGSANLALAKGTLRHRIFGWAWICAMFWVAVSSFWVRELNEGSFSWLHGLSLWTLFSMAAAIVSIRRGRVRSHAAWMIGTMVGVAVAGAFALAPGRFIAHQLGY